MRVSRWLARLRRLTAPALVVFAGAALGAAGMALAGSFGSRAWLAPSALTGNGAPRQPLNAQRVYDRLAPSILDITATLRYDDETAEGTGFVFDSPGALVLTNNHVIKDATSITATLAATGQTYRARLVGADTLGDIAVLRLDGHPRLPVAPAGDSGGVQLGDQVLVIGNQAGQGGPPTIAPGIINSLNRTIEATDSGAGFTETLRGMLQTSAQVEPGDSGGPLANAEGQVIGVDTAAGTGANAVGFAIPVNSALAAARRIAAGQAGPGVTLGPQAFLGVIVVAGPQTPPHSSLTDHPDSASPSLLPSVARATGKRPLKAVTGPVRSGGTPGRGAGNRGHDGSSCVSTAAEAVRPARVAPIRSGALVEGVLCGAPAAASGLAPGDMIIRAAGRAVPSPGALISALAGCEPGTQLPVTWVDLGGRTRTALIRVSAAPAP